MHSTLCTNEIRVKIDFPMDITSLRQWIGRTDVRTDQVAQAPVNGLTALLDTGETPPTCGGTIFPCWHWLYILPTTRQSELGEDGHPRRGGFLPPVPLPRRMWAGSRLSFVRASDRWTLKYNA